MLSTCALALTLSLAVPLAAPAAPRIEMEVQLGHVDSIKSVAVTPDGRIAASGADKVLLLWDLRSGKQLRAIPVLGGVNALAFTPDGKGLAVSTHGAVQVLGVQTGAPTKSFPAFGRVNALALSPDGRTLLGGKEHGALSLWNVKTGKEATLGGEGGDIRSVAFAGDGRSFLSGATGWMQLWSIGKDGRATLAREFKVNPGFSVNSVALSKDGRLALSGCARDLDLWDVKSGERLKHLDAHKDEVSAVALLSDGKRMVSASWDKTLRLWDIESGAVLDTFTGHRNMVMALAVLPDQERVLSASMDTTLKLWDLGSGKLLRSLQGASTQVRAVAFSSDGRQLFVGAEDADLKVWDLESLRVVRTLPLRNATALGPARSGGTLSAVGGYTYVQQLELAPGDAKPRLLMPTQRIGNAALSPDGRFALLREEAMPHTTTLWDVSKGEPIRPLAAVTQANILDPSWFPYGLSPDGRLGIFARGDELRLVDTESGSLVKSVPAMSSPAFAFSPDGKRLLVTHLRKAVLHDLGSDEKTPLEVPGEVACAAFSPDGGRIALGMQDGAIRLWEVGRHALGKAMQGHRDEVAQLVFSPDGTLLLSSSTDGTARLWNPATGAWVALLADASGSEWLIYDDEGHWDSSAGGGALVAMVQGTSGFNIDQFAASNNRPDLILQKLPRPSAPLVAHYEAQHARRLRRMGLVGAGSAKATDAHVPEAQILELKQDGKRVTLKLRLTDSRLDLIRYGLYVNDVPLFGALGKELPGGKAKAATVTETIELTRGDNKLEASCMNERGTESFRATAQLRHDGPEKGDLYYLGFGVSKYRDASLNLGYAAKDAQDLGAAYAAMKGKYAAVHVKTWVDDEVTPENLMAAKALLKDSRPEDTLVLFIAGHGVHDEDREATYYFLTHGADRNDLRGTAADFALVEDLLQGVAPRNKLFLMDTCESGEIDDQVQERYFREAGARGQRARTTRGLVVKPKPAGAAAGSPTAPAAPAARRDFLLQRDRFIYNDLVRRSGAIVFSSSRGGEFSYEDDGIKNGYFTRAVLQALKGTGVKVEGGVVSVDEIRRSVAEQVAKDTREAQHPTVDRDNLQQKFGFPVQ